MFNYQLRMARITAEEKILNTKATVSGIVFNGERVAKHMVNNVKVVGDKVGKFVHPDGKPKEPKFKIPKLNFKKHTVTVVVPAVVKEAETIYLQHEGEPIGPITGEVVDD